MDPFLGQIQTFGFNFAPRGWSTCEGQLLAIASNTALFSLLGTTYGGDGRTTFGLPDLRGRSIVGIGRGPGLSTITWGERGGSESFNILTNQLPPHHHTQLIPVNEDGGETDDPNNAVIGNSGTASFNAAASPNSYLKPSNTGNTGSGSSILKRSPFLGMYVCIALVGIFPSRS
ncbi:phage tail protein [Tenacibaculum jejuense]|uniref:Phage Tail Collar n=1 Tax=Tenacibaculum jejuense TaxID=584609 RepID=A0A238UDM2_9FLAO|nr:tail fiber protein [Tenacibaculum jejuense]SNR17116.1 Phage Tail Collar [Tenacibaculum jejuense]